tara:strand:- start:99 stop:374 length:276 start_codon:yes stop_codon:yes gene_type:complete
MNSLSDKALIKNHTIFFAYFCYLIESDLSDDAEKLCEIGWQLDEEIRKRKISNTQIKECIQNSDLNPQDQLMVSTYIFPDLAEFSGKIGKS